MAQVQWLDEVYKRKDQLVEELVKFLSIESILDESTAGSGAPFGAKIAEALQFMLDLGERDGFRTRNVDGYAGHIEYGHGEELIGVLAHVDVVPAGDGWTTHPFDPSIRDGKLYARGAIDDKGPAMAAYFAMKMIKELGLSVSKRIRLILGGDEESYWRCMKYYFEREEMPGMGFTPDADFPLIIAEKGFLDMKVMGTSEQARLKGYEWVLDEFVAGQRVNMVPDYAMAKLTGPGDVFDLKMKVQEFLMTHQIQGFAEEADDHLKIIMKGRAHHGSEPEKGLNAALELARFLKEVELDVEGARYIQMINDLFVDSFFGEKLGIAQEDDRVGKLTVNAGVFQYKHREDHYVRINVRYPIKGNSSEILTEIEEKVSNYGMRLTDIDHKPAHFCEPEHPLVQTLARVYEEQTGQKAELMAIGGGTYARTLDTGVAFGPVFPGKPETAHQKDEFIELEDLFKATAIYAQAIYELAK
ncbi:dipeptidase PepV [Thermoflavimicrobium dichotomicum]|uniref:Succinyl-diaminopimelate desuccinylase n=1 Tax=Thermoflavimicrobium dichotomicum TaxID=46223 RepID=A0A1I3MEM2_9BACL|nr:dipeptidase PepV [Thermoflavimicrobium dichotomicum]SFI95479.1 succinyl-diaminopimelate desuccinylase [Thermoflavimicrobium dichotomicum]